MTVCTLLVDVGQADITPITPVPLAGYAHRANVPFEGVDRRIELQAFWFTTGDTSGLLVSADVLWWPPERTNKWRQEIASRWPVDAEAVLLHATHTHSAPQTSTAFASDLGVADEEWVELLHQRLLDAVEIAWNRRQRASVSQGTGITSIGRNRRVAWEFDAPTLDDPEGAIDRTLTVFRIDDDSGKPFAILTHLACHPVINGLNRVSTDFPGVLGEALKARFGPDLVAGFLQGAAGDINPTVMHHGKNPVFGTILSDTEVKHIGNQLSAEVFAVLNSPMHRCVGTCIHHTSMTTQLTVARVPSLNDLQDFSRTRSGPLDGNWADTLIGHPVRLRARLPLHLGLVRITSGMTFAAFDAEMVTAYGDRVRHKSGGSILPLPYTNGMLGYVVTDQQLQNGGYESNESSAYFGLPAPFAPGIEDTVSVAIEQLIDANQGNVTA